VESPAEGEGRSTKGEGGGGGRSTESDSKSRKSDSKSRKVPIQNLRRAILSFFLFSPGRKYSPNVLYICTEGVPGRPAAPTWQSRHSSGGESERRWRRRRRGCAHRTFSLTSGSLLPLRNNPGDKGGRWISSASHRARPDDETALSLRYVSASSSTSLVEDSLPSPSILTSA
jgi:hypothetical protein